MRDEDYFFACLTYEDENGDTKTADTLETAQMVVREFGFEVDPCSYEGDGCWNIAIPFEPLATNVEAWGLEATLGAFRIYIEV